MGVTDLGKLGLLLMGRAMSNESLIQFSVDGWVCVPSLLLDLRSNYGGDNEDNGDFFQKVSCTQCILSAPNPVAGHHQPMPLLDTPGHSQTSLGQSFAGSLFLSPGSWCTQDFACALQESVSPILHKFYNRISLASEVRLPGGSQSHCQIPRLGNLLLFLELS